MEEKNGVLLEIEIPKVKRRKKNKKKINLCHSSKKRFIFSFFTFFPILLSLVIFVLFKHTRAGPQFFLFCYSTGENQLSTRFLQCQSRNTFFFVTSGGVGRPQKTFVCVTNLVLELTMGMVRWNLNLRVLNLLVTEND